jgi:uncharacterized protein YndB with AHSA1/START domain
MEKLQLTNEPVAKAEMLIRKPVEQVFDAFVNPRITKNFWFSRGSGRLEAGKEVTWDWRMYDISVHVDVLEVEENRRIVIDWSTHGVPPTRVEWLFTPYKGLGTFVSVTNSGFSGDGDAVVKSALDSTGGFSLVLAGAKAWLEHNIKLNLVDDHYPPDISTY